MAVLSRILAILRARPVGRLAAVLTLALLAPTFAARAQDSLEKAVKAAYLYKFAPFVSWPATTFTSPADPFDICIVGNDPFGALLDRATANQHVDGRAILIHRMPKADRKSSCQIMYIGGPPATVKEALQAVAGTPVLTVTDGPEAPGIVDFVMDQGRVRFRLNDQTAADNGLTISSKLLSLAVSVTQRKTTGTKP
jgi:hypothetical protein